MAAAQSHGELQTLDATTLQTLSYLESRLLRIEHILYGHTVPSTTTQALPSVLQLEHRFFQLTERVRTYKDLLQIYSQHPTLFSAPSTGVASAPELSPAALAQMVLASSTLYPSTASALRSIEDDPIPDPSLSANLISLLPKMRAIEATQKAQAAEIAELRARSEVLIRSWYETGVLTYGEFVAGTEKRLTTAEIEIRRTEKARSDA